MELHEDVLLGFLLPEIWNDVSLLVRPQYPLAQPAQETDPLGRGERRGPVSTFLRVVGVHGVESASGGAFCSLNAGMRWKRNGVSTCSYTDLCHY